VAPIEIGDDEALRDLILGGIGEDFFPFKIHIGISMSGGHSYLRLTISLHGSPSKGGWKLDPGGSLFLPSHALREAYKEAELPLWEPLSWEAGIGGPLSLGGNERKKQEVLFTLCDTAAPLFYEADPRIGMVRPPEVPFFDHGQGRVDDEFGKPCPVCGALTDPPGSTSKWGGWNLGAVHTYCL
jgi:hypothetical protein